LRSAEQFQKLMPRAVELRVVREKESVKLKLRTPTVLYTFRTNEEDAEDIIKGAKEIEVIEYTPAKEKSEKTDEKKKK
jgi:hypothetical protein